MLDPRMQETREAALDAIAPAVAALFARLGIGQRTVTHPAVHTVEQAKALRGTIPGGHVKNLFLVDKAKRMVLVTALEDSSIDLRALEKLLGAKGRFSFASAERLRDHLGVEPGSVTPLAAINDREGKVSVVLEARALAADPINCHPLTNTATTSLSPADLVRFLEATGHPPLVIDLPARESA